MSTQTTELRVGVFSHAELQLPSLVTECADAPQLEHPQFADVRMEVDRNIVFFDFFRLREIRFERIGFFQLGFRPLGDQIAGLVVLANGRREEAEGGGLADDQADRLARDIGFGSFFHAEGHDAEGAERTGSAGDGEAGGFDADVIAAGRAAADANAAAVFGDAVVGSAAGDGVVEVVISFEHFWRGRALCGGEPGADHFRQSVAERGGFEDAAVEEEMGSAGRVRLRNRRWPSGTRRGGG